jgi:hypothetical protein
MLRRNTIHPMGQGSSHLRLTKILASQLTEFEPVFANPTLETRWDLRLAYSGAVKMVQLRWKKFAVLTGVALALAACGGPSAEEFDAIAAEQKLNKVERVAFESCHQTMKGLQPILKFGIEQKMMSEVPLQVCACQSRAIVQVFPEDQYDAYAKVSKYLTRLEKKALPRYGRKQIKKGLETDSSVRKLVSTFEKCAIKYVADNQANPEFKDFLLAPPEPKKKKGHDDKAKQASNG